MRYLILVSFLFLSTGGYAKTIEGSFLQIGENESTLEWNKKEWEKEFTYMQDIGMNKLIIQWTALSDGLGDTSTMLVYYPNPVDPQFHTIDKLTQLNNKDILDTILSVCDGMGIEVYLGTLWKRGTFHYTVPDTLAFYAKRNIELIHELNNRYDNLFTGWYIPEEFNNLVERGDRFKEIAQIAEYWKIITDTCYALSGKPVMISPYFDTKVLVQGADSTYEVYEDYNSFRGWVDSLVKLSGIDILAIQDGIGSERFTLDTIPPYFQIMKERCDTYNVAFWTDIENFEQLQPVPNFIGIPADIERLLAQMDTEAPYVEKMVCFEFNHYMDPQTPASYPNPDSAKQLNIKLYNDYRRDFGFMGRIMDTTVWDSGTYNVTGDLVIDSGITLTTGPGVTVYFTPDADSKNGGQDTSKCELIVKGKLIAYSTTFTSDNLLDWYGIRVEKGGSLEIRGSAIRNARYGIYTKGTVLAINNIISNDSIGVYVDSNANLVDFGNLRNGDADDDGMNSIYNNTWNFVNAAPDSVFAQANWWGDTLKISGPVISNPPGKDWDGTDWIIANDSTIYGTHWNVGTFSIGPGKTVKVAPRSINTTGWIAIDADSIEIPSQSILSADSAGYSSDGPGSAEMGASSKGASGGALGGRSGWGGSNIQGDTTYSSAGCSYGSMENCCEMGSGGGASDPTLTYPATVGGGIIRFNCSGTTVINGTLRSNGLAGQGSYNKASGGASGGSIWLQTANFCGSGLISTRGGLGGNGSNSTDGGGGSGGRIHVKFTENSNFSGRLDCSGGDGPDDATSGQPGTILVQKGDMDRIVLSPINVANSPDSKDGFIKGLIASDRIQLSSGDSITGNVTLTADSIILNSGSCISADSKGYVHGQGDGAGFPGSSGHGGGAGSHFTIGGHGSYFTEGSTGDCGPTYDDTLNPDILGSGGGCWSSTAFWGGGTGGGRVILNAPGRILINGNISANASAGTSKTSYAGGGGSGGSILIYANVLDGTGTIIANGANGGAVSGCYGGGGAGGLIAVYRDNNNFTGTFSADSGLKGGGNATDGHKGIIHIDTIPKSGGSQSSQTIAKPLIFKLYQNYPNPSNKITTIKYEIPVTSKVSLRLYDLSGRCVKTLFEGKNQLPGIYKVDLNARDYPAGIYFAKYIAGKYKETKKLVLMR